MKRFTTAIELNRSGDSRPGVAIPVPFYLGGMSLPALSVIVTMLSRVESRGCAQKPSAVQEKAEIPGRTDPFTMTTSITQVVQVSSVVREERAQKGPDSGIFFK